MRKALRDFATSVWPNTHVEASKNVVEKYTQNIPFIFRNNSPGLFHSIKTYWQ